MEQLRRMRSQGTISRLDGIYITHYHDDHTDMRKPWLTSLLSGLLLP